MYDSVVEATQILPNVQEASGSSGHVPNHVSIIRQTCNRLILLNVTIRCKSQTIGIQEEQETTSTTTTNAVHAIYKDIQGSMLKQIKKQNLSNSFGSKIDMSKFNLLSLGHPYDADSMPLQSAGIYSGSETTIQGPSQ